MALRQTAPLAWCGWRIQVPEQWRPLRVAGDWDRGSMIIGDATEAVAQVSWSRPKKKRFDAGRSFARRLKRMRRTAASGGPEPEGFAETAWSPGDDEHPAFWAGYAPDAGLVVEALTSAEAPKRKQRSVTRRGLPTLRASRPAEPTPWAVYGASFVSPPGFTLRDRRLKLGDIALRTRSRDRKTLLLRAVYPADLALARRELADWLEFPVFKEHRRFRPEMVDPNWQVDSFGRTLGGVRRVGRKRIPRPLGWIASRHSSGAVVHDEELDRLLITELDTPAPHGEAALAGIVETMGWAHFEPEGLW